MINMYACATGSLICAAALAQPITFTPLTDLAGRRASDMSADGRILVGGAFDGSGAWRLENGVLQGLGTLGAPDRDFAYGISPNGQYIVGTAHNVMGSRQPFVWQDGGMQGLSFLPGADSGHAVDVSDDGRTIVGTLFGPTVRAVAWHDGVAKPLPGLAGADGDTRASGVSTDGTVIVGTAGVSGVDQAVTWVSGQLVPLAAVPGQGRSLAADVSADGSRVVGSAVGVSSGQISAVYWENGALHEIPTSSQFGASAFAISGDGTLIGGGLNPSLPFPQFGSSAFLWDEQNGFCDLSIWLPAMGVDLHGIFPLQVDAISHDGMFVLGTGVDQHGRELQWMLTIPGPSTAATITLAAGSLALRRRR